MNFVCKSVSRKFHSAISVCYEKFKPSEIYVSSWRKPLVPVSKFSETFVNTETKISLRNLLSKEWLKKKASELKKNQTVIDAGVRYLEGTVGLDIAVAHFVIRAGGCVKFSGIDRIYKKKSGEDYDSELPQEFNENYILEEVYLDSTKVYYDGLNKLKNLPSLKVLSFADDDKFNDWYIDFICGEIPSVMYLDISKCRNVTYRGIASLYRLKNLKVVNVSGISNNAEFKYACLELENDFPGISVIGVDVELQQTLEPVLEYKSN